MPRKVMPKIPANKVVDILEQVERDLELTANSINEKKYDAAVSLANNAYMRISGIKEGIDLIVGSPATTNGS